MDRTGLLEVYEMIDYHLSFLHSIRKDTPSIILRTSTEFWFISIPIEGKYPLFVPRYFALSNIESLHSNEYNEISESASQVFSNVIIVHFIPI